MLDVYQVLSNNGSEMCHMLKNRSEKLAFQVLSKLLPEGSKVVPIEEQSNGEHDFDVLDNADRRVAVVEVTSAIYRDSKVSLARQRRHGLISSKKLKHGWLLMTHNPDPRWIEKRGSEFLSVFERHGYTKFDHDTQYAQNVKVAQAAQGLWEMGIENGGSGTFEPGTISLLYSRGENSDCYARSHEHVTILLTEALNKDDNALKLSRGRSPQVERHLFVEIDEFTYPAAGDSMATVRLPYNRLDLGDKATHIWAAMRTSDRVIVWCSDATGWNEWILEADIDHESSV